LTGIGRYLREVSPTTKIIGVDAYGSVVFGAPGAARRLTGIGASKPSRFISKDIYDDYMLVQDEEAFAFCHALFLRMGMKLGGSSGCVLFACARFLAEHTSVSDVVCVCADSGENYNGTIYNETWIRQLSLDFFELQLHRDLEIIGG
jgi:cysteine synthase